MTLPEAIEKSGMSDAEIADAVRTARGTVSRWRNGHTRPARRLEAAIIKFLNERVDNSHQS